jgi:hypothetical protein
MQICERRHIEQDTDTSYTLQPTKVWAQKLIHTVQNLEIWEKETIGKAAFSKAFEMIVLQVSLN